MISEEQVQMTKKHLSFYMSLTEIWKLNVKNSIS